MLLSKPGLNPVNCYTSLCCLFFQREPAKGLQEGASGLQQMSWATSYKLEKESNPLRLIMGRGHTRSCVMSLWDGEKATASYWISRDRAWNPWCWLQAFTLPEQCLLPGEDTSRAVWGRQQRKGRTMTLLRHPLRTFLGVPALPRHGCHSTGDFAPASLFTQVQGS